MRHFKVRPDERIFNVIMNTFGKRGEIVEMLSWMNHMIHSEVRPSIVTFNTLINTYGMLKDFVKLKLVFETIVKDPDLKPNARTFSIIIHAFGQAAMFEEMENWFQRMSEEPYCFHPEEPVFNGMITAYGHHGKFEAMFNLLDRMKESGMNPSARTYTIVIHMLGKAKKIDEMQKWFEKMCKDGIQPNEVTFGCMLHAYREVIVDNSNLSAHTNDIVQEVLYLWSLLPHYRIRPNIVLYETLIETLIRANNLPEANKFFSEMKSNGLKPLKLSLLSLKKLYNEQKTPYPHLYSSPLEKTTVVH